MIPISDYYARLSVKPHSPSDTLIYQEVVKMAAPHRILEIGFFQGASALAWLYYSKADLVSIDPMGGVDNRPDNIGTLISLYPDRFRFIQDRSENLLTHLGLDDRAFDLIFVDGDHSRGGASIDFKLALGLGSPWMLVDDWAAEVVDAYNDTAKALFSIVRTFIRHEEGGIQMALMKRV